MVSDVAHELRTPLSNIRGWLEAAEDGVAAPTGRCVSSLLEEAMLLQHVIDDLQDLAAADAGELRLHRRAGRRRRPARPGRRGAPGPRRGAPGVTLTVRRRGRSRC